MRSVNNQFPQVSIGLPVYNGEKFLKQTLDSLIEQTFENFEIIISDNASTDTTEQICREYAAKDVRIRYYRNPENIGAAPNYNRVFKLARGQYFKWAAHDDLCTPHYLERCVEILDRHPSVVLCYTGVMFIDEQEQYIRQSSHLLELNFPTANQRFKHYQELIFPQKRSRKKGKISTSRTQSISNTSTKSDHPGGDRWTPIFGLIRTDILKKTALIASYVNSDMILLGELALYGEFYEISEPLFLYRDHRQASGRNHQGYYDYNAWFDPQNKGKLMLCLWTWFFQYLAAIARVKMGTFDKLACYLQMGRWFGWMWKRLVKELAINLAYRFKIRSISLGGFKKSLPTQW
jgi:glycosyltransferase involved in cell wall biosynthesis